MTPFAKNLTPPFYAVIFANLRTAEDDEGYERMAAAMIEAAQAMPGFLGIESARDADGFGITVSYWASEEAIANWKAQAAHLAAQRAGIERWYEHYELRVARIERAYSGPTGRSV